jgi:hypothetical protein
MKYILLLTLCACLPCFASLKDDLTIELQIQRRDIIEQDAFMHPYFQAGAILEIDFVLNYLDRYEDDN